MWMLTPASPFIHQGSAAFLWLGPGCDHTQCAESPAQRHAGSAIRSPRTTCSPVLCVTLLPTPVALGGQERHGRFCISDTSDMWYFPALAGDASQICDSAKSELALACPCPRRCRCQLGGAMAPVDPRMRALGSRWVDPWPCVLNAPCGLERLPALRCWWIDCLRCGGLPVSQTCPRTRPGTPSTLHTTPADGQTHTGLRRKAAGGRNRKHQANHGPRARLPFLIPLPFSPPLVMAVAVLISSLPPSKTQEA